MFTLPKDSTPTVDNIKAAISHNNKFRPLYTELENYYMGNHAILVRMKSGTLSNHKLVINHAKYITDINVAYLLGNPVEYQVKKEGLNIDAVLEEYKKQSIPDVDHEIAKNCSIFGRSYDYTYALEDNSVKSKAIDPRYAVIAYDNTMDHEPLFAVMYGKCEGDEYYDVTVIDKETIKEYNEKLTAVTSEENNNFKKVPLVEYRNNPECMGDFYQVRSLINAYNILQSDRINDKEQLVEALLVLKGFGLTEDQVTEVNESRMITDVDKEASAEYLVKPSNEADMDILRVVLKQDIHKISMTPDMSDENFVGNSSGVALKYKLLPFEQNTQNKERYFERSLKERFELYNSYLSLNSKMSMVPAYEVDAVFTRNLPQNDLETSQIINNLRGIVDDATLISQISFVKDAEASLEKAQEQVMERATAMASEFGTTTPTGEAPEEKKSPAKK